jgi:hypothetical protein
MVAKKRSKGSGGGGQVADRKVGKKVKRSQDEGEAATKQRKVEGGTEPLKTSSAKSNNKKEKAKSPALQKSSPMVNATSIHLAPLRII